MNVGIRLIQVAAVYMTAGLVIGLVMSIGSNYALSSVHAHISLLGWATMAITGIVYILMPGCSDNKLAKLHFWGHNIGLPVTMFSLTLYVFGFARVTPVLAGGSVLVAVSLLLFTVNVLRNGTVGAPRRMSTGAGQTD